MHTARLWGNVRSLNLISGLNDNEKVCSNCVLCHETTFDVNCSYINKTELKWNLILTRIAL